MRRQRLCRSRKFRGLEKEVESFLKEKEMKIRFGLKAIGWIALLFAGVCFGGYRTLDVPVLQGDWWQIAEKAPDVSPYNTETHNACDFTIWQDDAGDWHLVSCIRGTSWQGQNRLFHSWGSSSLTQTMWDSSVFTNDCVTSNGTVTTTNGISQLPKEALGQGLTGSIQAPHCFKEAGEYHFFYSASSTADSLKKAAWVRNSPDGSTYSFADDNTNKLFLMGRDVMIYDNRADDGLWYASYTGKGPDKPTDHVVVKTAASLAGPWTTEAQSISISGNPESPFIVKRGEWYYLWQQSQVRASKTLTNFTDMVTDMDLGKYAPEVFELGGQEYIAAYGGGIHVSKFGWVTREVSDADLVKMRGSFDEPAFDSTQTVYLGTEANWKTTVSYTRFLPAQEASTQTVTLFNASNPSGTPVVVTLGNNGEKDAKGISIDAGENRTEFQITATDGQQRTYVMFFNRQNADGSYDSFIMPMNMYPHVAENTVKTIGIRLSANPGSNKTVTVSKQGGGDDDLTLAGGTADLLFTTSNWEEPQFITIQARSDADELKGTATFRCSASGLNDQDIVATEREVALADDTDSDGIPDWWEAQHYDGLTVADPADVASNGINTVGGCYIAGLNPTNVASLFWVSDFSPQPSVLRWNAVSGRVYSVYWTSNLLSGFQPLETNIAWTAVPYTDTNHPGGEKGFYKIEVEIEE